MHSQKNEQGNLTVSEKVYVQIAGTAAVDGGDSDGIDIEAQLVEFIEFGRQSTNRIALVNGRHNRLAGANQHRSDVTVIGSQTGADVAQKDDYVSGVNGNFCLHPHMLQDDVIVVRLDTAGINEHTGAVLPFDFIVDAVTGYAGGIFHNGDPLTGQLIEKGGLAHVGASYDGNDRFCHSISPILSQI